MTPVTVRIIRSDAGYDWEVCGSCVTSRSLWGFLRRKAAIASVKRWCKYHGFDITELTLPKRERRS